MKSIITFISLYLAVGYSLNTIAQSRPEWVDNIPVYKDGACFQFFVGHGTSTNKHNAEQRAYENAKDQLKDYRGHKGLSTERQESSETTIISGKTSTTETTHETVRGESGKFSTGLIRQENPYFEKIKGVHDCWILYVLETCPDTHLPDNAFPRRKTGARFLLPSLAQAYKWQSLKAWLIRGGVALVGTGVIWALSNQNFYQKQATLYNTNASRYSTYIQQRDDWEAIKKGIGWGGGGLLFTYNTIDAVVTKGPRDYSKQYSSKSHAYWDHMELKPYGAMNHAGLTLSYVLP